MDRGPHSLHLDLRSLGAVVRVSSLLEPRVLQSLFGRDTVLWIVDKDPFEQIFKMLQESCVAWNNVLQKKY